VIVLIDREVVEALDRRPGRSNFVTCIERRPNALARTSHARARQAKCQVPKKGGSFAVYSPLSAPFEWEASPPSRCRAQRERAVEPAAVSGRASAPIMKENHDRTVSGHVVMNGNHVQTVLAKGF